MLRPSVLEQELCSVLESAAKQAILETFSGYQMEEGDKRNEIAEKFSSKFASVASKGLTNAIDAYIKSATILGGIVNTAGSPTAQVGSITATPTIS